MVDIPLTTLITIVVIALGFFYYIHGKFDDVNRKFDNIKVKHYRMF